ISDRATRLQTISFFAFVNFNLPRYLSFNIVKELAVLAKVFATFVVSIWRKNYPSSLKGLQRYALFNYLQTFFKFFVFF
ncbi:MAG: hypothetical protein MJY55_06325, partial [Bacteroidales bacterium]|nr:hypothetical protein [Bacteroidales bacterium]